MNKQQLRRQLRKQRKNLSPQYVNSASKILCQQIANTAIFKKSKNIALYNPIQNEVNPLFLLENKHKNFYLPILLSTQHLLFAPYKAQQKLYPNKYHIGEPKKVHLKSIFHMDLIIMPLLGFDEQGNRLGMGAGFYDRTLEIRNFRGKYKKPYLLGMAYPFQQIESLDKDDWDVSLDDIIYKLGVT